MDESTVERKAAWILAAIAVSEGWWLFAMAHTHPARFLQYTGFIDGGAGPAGWVLGLAVSAFFTARAAQRLPSVRANLFNPSLLKLLAVAVAIASAFCEEAVFRKLLMDGLVARSVDVQILASALAFGAIHGIWGAFHRSVRTMVGASVATGALGGALAVVYVVSRRSLAPCVAAHFLINLLAEPGLVLAALRGEMASVRPRTMPPTVRAAA